MCLVDARHTSSGMEREGEGGKMKEGERVEAIWKEGDRAFTSKAVRGA